MRDVNVEATGQSREEVIRVMCDEPAAEADAASPAVTTTGIVWSFPKTPGVLLAE